MKDLAALVLRLTVGTLVAGHGAQKLFGWFGGPGLKGTHGFMESLGMKQGHIWGTMGAAGEFGGGTLTALGFLNPIGPLNVASVMAVAIRRVHWNKPIWNMQGGAEFPLTNLAVALALTLTGPGRYSLDRVFGIHIPRWFAALCWLGTAGSAVAAMMRPDIASTIMEKVQATVSGTTQPANDPTLEMENRPQAASEQPATA